ncbi:uncharacterized protein IL334_006939 [Kwoniella shivajii]|uniref:Uncharacterized protein n=1 Tax=Kwoniella shivajii TaxID=564305 RepID=A0ABZ1D7T2_9TREE|nr:hypothetical protein IL334_006939 [Kwoniella shivajii]
MRDQPPDLGKRIYRCYHLRVDSYRSPHKDMQPQATVPIIPIEPRHGEVRLSLSHSLPPIPTHVLSHAQTSATAAQREPPRDPRRLRAHSTKASTSDLGRPREWGDRYRRIGTGRL